MWVKILHSAAMANPKQYRFSWLYSPHITAAAQPQLSEQPASIDSTMVLFVLIVASWFCLFRTGIFKPDTFDCWLTCLMHAVRDGLAHQSSHKYSKFGRWCIADREKESMAANQLAARWGAWTSRKDFWEVRNLPTEITGKCAAETFLSFARPAFMVFSLRFSSSFFLDTFFTLQRNVHNNS